MHTIRRFFLFVVCNLVLLTLALPAWAGEDPLRLAFINASQKGGGDAYDTLLEFLEASDDIKVKDSEKIWAAAEEEGVERKDFRNSKRRAASSKEFRRVMKSLDLEAIMILDVFSKNRKLQLVVIGPDGKEVADVRENIKRGKVSKTQAKSILKESFAELVPQVRDFREAGGWAAVKDEPRKTKEPEETDETDETDEELADEELTDEDEQTDDDASLKQQALSAQSSEYGLDPGFSLQFGALIGSRSLLMESELFATNPEEGFQLKHKSPFIGVAGRLEGILTTFSGGSAAVAAAVFGAYAPFTTIFDNTEELPSAYGRLGAELTFIKAFSESVALDVFAGVEAWSITIDKNRYYTGNRYLSGRVGAYISYAAGPLIVGAGAGVLPAFDINNSDGAFGTTELTLGLEGQAGLTARITDAIEASAGYTYTSISPDYPTPAIIGTPENPDPISSSDVVHSAIISIGYRL